MPVSGATTLTVTKTTTVASGWWYLIPGVSAKVSRTFVVR